MEPIADQLLDVSAEATSPAYITDAAYFRSFIRDPTKYLFVYRESEDGIESGVVELTDEAALERTDWTVRGFNLSGQYTAEEYADHISVPVAEVFERTPLTEGDFPLSVFGVTAVSLEAQGLGIGTQLATKGSAPLFASPPIVINVWLREDNQANQHMMRIWGDHQVATFPDYFPPEWECPDCGYENDCDCTVEMYALFGDERDEDVIAHNRQRVVAD